MLETTRAPSAERRGQKKITLAQSYIIIIIIIIIIARRRGGAHTRCSIFYI
jgi:hypothetical protein